MNTVTINQEALRAWVVAISKFKNPDAKTIDHIVDEITWWATYRNSTVYEISGNFTFTGQPELCQIADYIEAGA